MGNRHWPEDADEYVEQLEQKIQEQDDHIEALTAERDGLRAIVDLLPKTADGVPVVPESTVWWPYDDKDFGDGPHEMEVGQFWKWSSEQEDWEDNECGIAVPCAYVNNDWVSRDLRDCYSTREAAEAARKGDG